MKPFLAVLFIVALVGLFIFSYLLNKKTPKPEGCKEVGDECESCNVLSCPSRVNNIKEKQ